ncbi:MAG: SEC-C domain-containing protein [Paenibacillaceae bacterium]|uniref:SEC-C domain-containing protein n=1 Tax=Paenibacillus mellifer TaxID=2937794 RepID=A0A9X1XXP0_9BACL|nr:SEC-C metal-binding domain-containing protein [Paenibacillus mellifer]MBW4840037.1 SEC-C domain-containing protein [Paenibacillaceae bacterium]MCK8485648.1 SEC-C domain-containing protein [Paenibacillus mellifer]
MIDETHQLLEENNIKHAIIGEAMHRLADILPSLTKNRLAAAASVYNISGRSKMKKEELAAAVQAGIEELDTLQAALINSRPKEWELFGLLLDGSYQPSNATPFGYYYYFLDRGLLFTFFENNQLHLVIPDEVKSAIRKLDQPSFRQALQRSHQLYNYLMAAINLYGIIAPAKLVEIINAQNGGESITEEELLQQLEGFLQRTDQYFELRKGYIASVDMEDKEFEDLVDKVQGKPYYVPDQQELFKFADQDYFEITPQLTALREFVTKEFRLDPESAEYLVDDIQLACSMEASLEDLLYEFERRDLDFTSQKQAQQTVALITDVYDHTRMWSNAGHTLDELRQMQEMSGGQSATPSIRGHIVQQVRSNKIGRNEPCPCGSGLKYKKCCGK